MKQSQEIVHKILTAEQLTYQLKRWELLGKKVAFTNGVFDILHLGHITLLSQAAAFSDILIVGVNSDASVKKLKGSNRPINSEGSRALVLAAFVMVDIVVIFDEETPLELIKKIAPEVLIKGGDYTIDTIVGAKEVISKGGRVEIIPIEEGYSTTGLLEKLKSTQ